MSTQAVPDQRSGWIQFAAVVLFTVGVFRIIEAIAYFEKSHKLNDPVEDIPNDASVGEAVSDMTGSANAVVSAAKTTASQVNCS
jgi:hypothetical protein